MIADWKKNKSISSQVFTLDSENEEVTGILHWNLNKNYWKFEYPNSTWEIKDSKLIKTSNNEIKTYSCVGLASFLKHPIDEWEDILEKQYEVRNNNIGLLFVLFNKKPMIWKYKIEPFALLSVALEDTANRYYQINFEINEDNESTELPIYADFDE